MTGLKVVQGLSIVLPSSFQIQANMPLFFRPGKLGSVVYTNNTPGFSEKCSCNSRVFKSSNVYKIENLHDPHELNCALCISRSRAL